MNTRLKIGILSIIALISGVASTATAQSSGYKISAPYTYKNLTIFLIHGKDESKKTNMMTLQEAMERKLFRVYETSEVNELEVENLSKEQDVFIQSGDIVKGGKQDRVLAVSIIIPARSGRVKIEAFCVESGRWEKRGNEESKQFTSSNDRIVTRDLKIAANASRSQTEVWSKVSEAQASLGQNVGGTVNSGDSASSLQLSLENRKVVASVDEYIKKLSSIIDGKSDVIGYAFAINGQINSADIFVSNSLFKKLWSKNLKATATEAVAAQRGVRLADEVKADAVKGFITDSDKAKPTERATGGARLVKREDKDNVMIEAMDDKSKVVVHKTYVKKN
ncbi:MAG: hypothetical protein IPI64_06655 [Chloracidobacterium sp.]|nr:hypothetical protein [Chloracidobacterium sp.]